MATLSYLPVRTPPELARRLLHANARVCGVSSLLPNARLPSRVSERGEAPARCGNGCRDRAGSVSLGPILIHVLRVSLSALWAYEQLTSTRGLRAANPHSKALAQLSTIVDVLSVLVFLSFVGASFAISATLDNALLPRSAITAARAVHEHRLVRRASEEVLLADTLPAGLCIVGVERVTVRDAVASQIQTHIAAAPFVWALAVMGASTYDAVQSDGSFAWRLSIVLIMVSLHLLAFGSLWLPAALIHANSSILAYQFRVWRETYLHRACISSAGTAADSGDEPRASTLGANRKATSFSTISPLARIAAPGVAGAPGKPSEASAWLSRHANVFGSADEWLHAAQAEYSLLGTFAMRASTATSLSVGFSLLAMLAIFGTFVIQGYSLIFGSVYKVYFSIGNVCILAEMIHVMVIAVMPAVRCDYAASFVPMHISAATHIPAEARATLLRLVQAMPTEIRVLGIPLTVGVASRAGSIIVAFMTPVLFNFLSEVLRGVR